MSMRKTALKVAPTVVGKHHDEAFITLLRAGLSVRFIVMQGKRCAVNTTQENDSVCLFTDEHDIVFKAVVGSYGIYDDPDYAVAMEHTAD
jgi:hypothetical protein